jgi:hypothetical protein
MTLSSNSHILGYCRGVCTYTCEIFRGHNVAHNNMYVLKWEIMLYQGDSSSAFYHQVIHWFFHATHHTEMHKLPLALMHTCACKKLGHNVIKSENALG